MTASGAQAVGARGSSRQAEKGQAYAQIRGRSRSGAASKLHALADEKGGLAFVFVTPGNISDIANGLVASILGPNARLRLQTLRRGG